MPFSGEVENQETADWRGKRPLVFRGHLALLAKCSCCSGGRGGDRSIKRTPLSLVDGRLDWRARKRTPTLKYEDDSKCRYFELGRVTNWILKIPQVMTWGRKT